MQRPRIVVVGSINMDLVYRTQRLPRPGETLIGYNFSEVPGGKGANQAVAAARLGASVAMIGRVGNDTYGERLLDGLRREEIEISPVMSSAGSSSGVAVIGVDDNGQNSITVIPGANAEISPADVLEAESVFRGADVLLLQFEIPLPAIQQAINLGRKHGLKIILDPAPARAEVPADILRVDILCPNETEAESLSEIQVSSVNAGLEAAVKIRSMGAALSIVTMGSQGVIVCDGATCEHVSPFPVDAIDSTAAGDAFAAALGVAIADGRLPIAAVHFAAAAGALATTRRGAQPSMPTREEVEALLSLRLSVAH